MRIGITKYTNEKVYAGKHMPIKRGHTGKNQYANARLGRGLVFDYEIVAW